MASGKGCVEMMEALSIGNATANSIVEPALTDVADDDMLDGETLTSSDSQLRVTHTVKKQNQFGVAVVSNQKGVRKRRIDVETDHQDFVHRWRRQIENHHHDRCCLLCGYRAPHKLLLQIHLSMCRKTSSWRALYSRRTVEFNGNEMATVSVGLE